MCYNDWQSPHRRLHGRLGVQSASFQKSYMYLSVLCGPFEENSQLILLQVQPAVLARERAIQYSTDLPFSRHYL